MTELQRKDSISINYTGHYNYGSIFCTDNYSYNLDGISSPKTIKYSDMPTY